MIFTIIWAILKERKSVQEDLAIEAFTLIFDIIILISSLILIVVS